MKLIEIVDCLQIRRDKCFKIDNSGEEEMRWRLMGDVGREMSLVNAKVNDSEEETE